MKLQVILFSLALCFTSFRCFAGQADITFADFEGQDYGTWTATGTAFGSGPAHGPLPDQMPVDGYNGSGFVTSYHGGDDSTGKLTSPEFAIERNYIQFLIGGGGFPGETCMNLVVDSKAVRTATGTNTEPGGSEHLAPGVWDVHDFLGKKAHIEIVDTRTGGWGHINVDDIVFTDKKPALQSSNLSRDIDITETTLNFPVKNQAPQRDIKVLVDGNVVRSFSIGLADNQPDWWAPLEVNAWKGKTLTIAVDSLPADSKSLAGIEESDGPKNSPYLYHEPFRPQFHFSAAHGWLNDPNGLVFFKGEYHLFFQHNPYGTEWGNMHWGHATSPDLVHWHDRGEALYPDELGTMWSGSAVVDWKNSSGFDQKDTPPMVLIYTAVGNLSTQCLAFSSDGRSFNKYAGNPVLPQIAPGNRDPKVMWYAPGQKWIMVLYVALPDPTNLDAAGKPIVADTIFFLSSPDLKNWTQMSHIKAFAECPDLFALPLDGDATKVKWVLTGASSDYMVGTFDGTTFTPETPPLQGQKGDGFYAAQTYSDEPHGRRIRIGWLKVSAPGMPFSQAMSLPMVLSLRNTVEGPRLTWRPVPELTSLRSQTFAEGALELKEADPNPAAHVTGELVEIDSDFVPSENSQLSFNLRGIVVNYDAKKQELNVNGRVVAAPLQNGRQKIVIYLDRTSVEVFASDGLVYVPLPVIPASENHSFAISTKDGQIKFSSLSIYGLQSAWPNS